LSGELRMRFGMELRSRVARNSPGLGFALEHIERFEVAVQELVRVAVA